MCQCPERGDLHFHLASLQQPSKKTLMCQCPERGDLHFHVDRPDVTSNSLDCVNALKGATFISTLLLF